MKVNLKQVVIKDIEGNEMKADFSKQIGNYLYMQGQDIEECELGKKIYFAEGEVEMDEKECEMVRRAVSGYSYIARTAVSKSLSPEKTE